MKDVFYTLLVFWILWKVVNSIYIYKLRRTHVSPTKASNKNETTITNSPPTKSKINITEAETVDFEEIK